MEDLLAKEQTAQMASDVTICRRLRTKSYYVMGRFHHEMGESSTTAQYWCLNTMLPFGPDGSYASPEGCLEGRCCFNCK